MSIKTKIKIKIKIRINCAVISKSISKTHTAVATSCSTVSLTKIMTATARGISLFFNSIVFQLLIRYAIIVSISNCCSTLTSTSTSTRTVHAFTPFQEFYFPKRRRSSSSASSSSWPMNNNINTNINTNVKNTNLNQSLNRNRNRDRLLTSIFSSPPLFSLHSETETEYTDTETDYKETETDTERDPETDSNNGIRVGIAGAGAVAFGTAAILANQGHDPMIWSPSGAGTAPLLQSTTTRMSNSIQSSASESSSEKEEICLLTATGALDNFQFNSRIAHSPQQLVEMNDVLFIALPANGHKKVFDELAPFIRKDQHIIISSHSSFGALYLSRLLHDKFSNNKANNGNEDNNNGEGSTTSKAETKTDTTTSTTIPPITAWGTTICTARRVGPSGTGAADVRVNTVRQSVDLCTIPQEYSNDALQTCQKLFPKSVQFATRDGLLAVSLSNLNPQNHLGIALGNMGRMEKGENWYQSLNITPNIGRLLEALDQERLTIAQALLEGDKGEGEGGNNVKTIFQHFSWSFHVPITDSISDMNQEIHKIGNDVYGPNTANSRYVTEDVPFGLASTIVLGEMVGKPAVLHKAGMDIMSAMYGRDFWNENDLLHALQLETYSLDELKEAAFTGLLLHK